VIAERPSCRCFTRGVRDLGMADCAHRAALGAARWAIIHLTGLLENRAQRAFGHVTGMIWNSA
jgi:hypothetical protein